VPQKPYTKTIAYEKSGHFSNLERKIFVSKKKVLQPKSISKKKKSCSPGLVCITELQKNTQQSRISIAHFFSPVFVFCQKPNKISFPNVKI